MTKSFIVQACQIEVKFPTRIASRRSTRPEKRRTPTADTSSVPRPAQSRLLLKTGDALKKRRGSIGVVHGSYRGYMGLFWGYIGVILG